MRAVDAESFSLHAALAMARAATLAYAQPATITRVVGERTELSEHHRFSFPSRFRFIQNKETDTEGYCALIETSVAAGHDLAALVALRGTETDDKNARDFKTDLRAWQAGYADGDTSFTAHKGFLKAYLSVRDDIRSWLWEEARPPPTDFRGDGLAACNLLPVYVVGHSLGAALATLVVADGIQRISRRELPADTEPFPLFPSVDLYTFGSPRVGDRSLAAAVAAAARREDAVNRRQPFRHIRFVNNNDIVPRLPPRLPWSRYRHCGERVYFTHNGEMKGEGFGGVQRVKDCIRGRISALRNGAPFDALYDHDMSQYQKRILGALAMRGEVASAPPHGWGGVRKWT